VVEHGDATDLLFDARNREVHLLTVGDVAREVEGCATFCPNGLRDVLVVGVLDIDANHRGTHVAELVRNLTTHTFKEIMKIDENIMEKIFKKFKNYLKMNKKYLKI
jgi:hypothetical protein